MFEPVKLCQESDDTLHADARNESTDNFFHSLLRLWEASSLSSSNNEALHFKNTGEELRRVKTLSQVIWTYNAVIISCRHMEWVFSEINCISPMAQDKRKTPIGKKRLQTTVKVNSTWRAAEDALKDTEWVGLIRRSIQSCIHIGNLVIPRAGDHSRTGSIHITAVILHDMIASPANPPEMCRTTRVVLEMRCGSTTTVMLACQQC